VLTFIRQIRLAYPARGRISWIQDNLSANWVPPSDVPGTPASRFERLRRGGRI
jgi:hypothetical protein